MAGRMTQGDSTMKFSNDSTRDESAFGHRLGGVAVRSYLEIATILSEREGVEISAEHVKQTCERAEFKVARTLRSASPRGGSSHGDAVSSRPTSRPWNNDRAL